ncbi:MAG: helix-turn-helix domain-containing protein [Clostridia bacterium]|nr:helix-turn-helix domain-containing protein [Clostridia bacterium]
MPIYTNLDELMRERELTIATLAKEVGISPVNLSIIKTGKARAIRFDTLDALCRALCCSPGDIIKYKERKNVIPFFLDYSGTTDLLLKGGAENVKRFFDTIILLQEKLRSEVRITMVTGSAFETAKSKHKMLNELAGNYGLTNLFDGVVAEYCGFIIKKGEAQRLLGLDPRILSKRSEIEELAKKYCGRISADVTSMYNVTFESITRAALSSFAEEAEKIVGSPEIEAIIYYDDYGKECDIKPRLHAKSEAVYMLVKKLKERYSIPFVIVGGDSQDEDLKMYTQNKKRFEKMGLKTIFIAPSNIGEIQKQDKDIITGKWENLDGIVDAIQKLQSRINLRDDGGFEYE